MKQIIQTNPHYHAISTWYGDRRAKRSNLPLMNHIHEGLVILDLIDASTEAQEAFCIHPILQEDAALLAALNPWESPDLAECSIRVVLLGVAYRQTANAYLSKHYQGRDDAFQLSPIPEVNQMLIADKVQNFKDFEIHHQQHPKAEILRAYFQNWLHKLGITQEFYQRLAAAIKS